MSTFLERSAYVIVDGRQYDGLRLQFKVVRTSGKAPNTCEVVISNLSQDHRGEASKRYAPIVLVAGYKGDEAQLFSGQSRFTNNTKRGTDWETHIQCGDGEKSYVYANANQSWSSGTPLAVVAQDLVRLCGLKPGNIATATATSTAVYARGFVVNGSPIQALDKVMGALKLKWSIQDGAVQALQLDAALNQQAVVLNRDSGLVGTPEQGAPTKKDKRAPLKVSSLLQPKLKPGSAVLVQSGSINGLYRVERVEHVGDTWGLNWYSNLEVFPLSGFSVGV